MKFLYLLLLFSLSSLSLDAQIFSQDFSSSTVVSDYVSTTPSSGQFNSISTSGAGVAISINGGVLEYVRTGNAGSFSRTTDFTPTPYAIKVSFDLEVPAATTNQTTAAVLQFGSNYGTTNSSESNANTHTRIGINLVMGGGFSLRDIDGSISSGTFSGTQTVTMYINNSASSGNYIGPDATYNTINSDKIDVWIGTTLAFDEKSATTASQILTDIKFAFTNGTGTIRFDNFNIQSNLAALPIELESFNAKLQSTTTLLSFSTATELNNSHFVIERSTDARNFKEIGQVQGAGTTRVPQSYTFTDEKPLSGVNYYRLRQVDFDGMESFSPVVSVVFGKTGYISIAPSPATDRVRIQLEESYDNDGLWQVYDQTGRQVLSGTWEAESTDYELNVNTLPEGMYTFRLVVGAQVQVKQFRKM